MKTAWPRWATSCLVSEMSHLRQREPLAGLRVSSRTPPFVYSPQVCYWRSLDQRRLHPAILYCWMLTDEFRSQVNAVAGQTDMAPYVSLRDQRMMKIPVFSESQGEVAERVDLLLERQAATTVLLDNSCDTWPGSRSTTRSRIRECEASLPPGRFRTISSSRAHTSPKCPCMSINCRCSCVGSTSRVKMQARCDESLTPSARGTLDAGVAT